MYGKDPEYKQRSMDGYMERMRSGTVNNMENGELEIDLLKLLQALWRKAWAIVLVTAIAGGAVFAATAVFIRPKYRAEALMYVNSSNISVGGTKVSISQSELSAAQTLVDTYIVILNTRTTLEDVIERTGVSYDYEELKEMITAESVNGTEVFSIQVVSKDPAEAEKLANAIAQTLPEKIASIVEGSSARIVDYAVIPAEKDSPSLVRNTAVGMILGFVLICAVIVVQELMDDLIHDADYLNQTYDIPVLAVIPDLLSTKSSNDYYKSAEQRAQKAR